MPARRHHYVPQFYLKGFVEDRNRPRLFVVDIDERHTFSTAPANVAVERDFHTIEAAGQPPDAVERMLAGLEGEISSAMERIISSRSLSDHNDRIHLFIFMALLLVKNPGMRARIGSFIGQVTMARFQMLASDAGAWNREMESAKDDGTIPRTADTDQLRELVLAGAFNIGVTAPGHLQLEFNLVDEIAALIASRRWMLYRSQQGRTGFVTSDNPVSLTWAQQGRPDPPGLGRGGTQLIFAISNELAAVGAFEVSERTVDADEDSIAKINGNIIVRHNHQVYARGDDFIYWLRHNEHLMEGRQLLDDAGFFEQREESGDSG
jgi:hypothetical protein